MIAAFFDIDGTLHRGSLLIEHFKKLVKYEVVNPTIWHGKIKDMYQLYEKRRGEYDDYMDELASGYIKSLTGANLSSLDFIANQVIKLEGDKVYSYTRNRIQYHKDNGHLIFFISGSPDYLVSKMARKYGVTEYVGSKYILDEDGCFTGEVVRMWDSESKLKAIADIVKRYDISMEKSFAYGDTRGDISMLTQVGNPIAINPTFELLSHINENKDQKDFKVVIERKDVIYELSRDSNVNILDFRHE